MQSVMRSYEDILHYAISPPGAAKAAGGTMCTKGTCGVLHNAEATVGIGSNKDCNPLFPYWNAKMEECKTSPKHLSGYICGPLAVSKINHRTACVSLCITCRFKKKTT